MIGYSKRTEIILGCNLKLTVNKGGSNGDGFTLWYRDRWIIDASCFTDDNEVRVSNELILVNPDDSYDGKTSFHYQLKKRGKAKISPAKSHNSTKVKAVKN